MISEIEGYQLLGNDGDSFELIIHNGFLLAKEEIWFTSAKTTAFMILNSPTINKRFFSQQELL